jgi:4-amino-4-deoxy-L-arabinose transferase-like glycosyltransferase
VADAFPTPRVTHWIALAIILLAGLAVRVGWGVHQSSDADAIAKLPDQREYLELAQNLADGKGYWFADARFASAVYAYRTPGYPLLMMACQNSPRIIRLVQALVDASTILAIYLLARRWLTANQSVVAAGLVAVNPYLIFFTGQLLTETFFTALLAWGMVLLIYCRGPWPAGRLRMLGWITGALLLGLAVLVRPGALALPALLGAAAALVNYRDGRAYRTWWPLPVATVMILITALVLLPWAMRNRYLLGTWVWTSTNDGITQYDGFNPDATGASDQSFTQKMPWLSEMTEVARSRYLGGLADRWMKDHPLDALQLAGIKIARTWSPMPLSNEYGSQKIDVAIGLIFGIAFDLMILLGIRQTTISGPVKSFLLLPAVYFTIAAALSVGSLRYLVPAQAPMAIVAASGLGIFSRRGRAIPGRQDHPGASNNGDHPGRNGHGEDRSDLIEI